MGRHKYGLTPEEEIEGIRQRLRYEPETGKFFYLMDIGRNCAKAGEEFKGCLTSYGYLRAQVNGKHYLLHRLAWLLMKGEWPDNIDHINHLRNDNRFQNLRSVTNAENKLNMSKRANNKSGVTGVDWYNRDKKWRVQICLNGKHKWLGCYADFDEACRVRWIAEKELGFHENHGGKNEKTSN